MKYQFSLFILLFSSVAYSQSPLYSAEDLKILQSESNYKEFLEHAHDIRPSKRTASWKESLLKMAQGYHEDLIAKKDYSRLSFNFSEKISSWSTLQEDEIYQLKKTKYTLRYLGNCFSNATEIEKCQSDLKRFWNHSIKYVERPDISYRLGSLMYPYQSKEQSWEFFKVAANSKLSIFYCKEKLVQNVILERAGQVELNDPTALKQLNELANQECWQKVAPALINRLASANNSESQQIFKLLETLKLLGQHNRDIYLTRYLLLDPSPGDTFNLAWNNIKLIAQDYPRRMKVIESLKKFDPLPGASFNSKDSTKRDILIDLVSKSIPEYLNYYCKTCYQYFSGVKRFPNGNPTIECAELVKNSQAEKIISPKILAKLKKLLTFI